MSSTSSFPEKIEILVNQDASYAPEAYYFLRDALETALKARKKQRRDPSPHVSAGELLEAFRLHALREFGPMAQTVLEYWGVNSCEDVGCMVFNLVEAGVFGKTEQDTLDAFRQGYDFDEAFGTPFLPPSFLPKKS
jgi:uncharacterized repeat protein (TIGR04138 family)